MRGTQAALVRHIGIAWTIVPEQVPSRWQKATVAGHREADVEQ